ncbi:zinc ion binding nucleic acid binding protein [Trifolium pratense]|uniref:Zinc ion binding nucleic acid binding protein n=1 Tax=Trifolium pratense TaxID=57577 RepID=A0A2K3M7J9_TRIPR|nr:zinc ion binding nucleic acid binding protein [Trifolium pratense]
MQSTDNNVGSYRDKVMGERRSLAEGGEEEEEDGEEEDGERMKVEEHVIGEYECPDFIFSKLEEKRLYRPWRRGVIVKLLGRRIGYKALENRLKQMWVRKGVINIIDLKWSPNFHPASDTIKEVAVWLRISGLPIEYYDSGALHFIGNRVGKTVKVDKNTLTQERGKYARLCVQVNLTKPLLAMFTIKGRKYNIEYEGLHMLCTTCGRFGHYKDGCPIKVKDTNVSNTGKESYEHGESQNHAATGVDGPWKVVHKQRRNRKANPGRNIASAELNAPPAKVNDSTIISGSRFIALSDDGPEIEKEGLDNDANPKVNEMEREDSMEVFENKQAGNNHHIKHKRGNGGTNAKKGEGASDKVLRESKLATRGSSSFKGKMGSNVRKGVESVVEKMGFKL